MTAIEKIIQAMEKYPEFTAPELYAKCAFNPGQQVRAKKQVVQCLKARSILQGIEDRTKPAGELLETIRQQIGEPVKLSFENVYQLVALVDGDKDKLWAILPGAE